MDQRGHRAQASRALPALDCMRKLSEMTASLADDLGADTATLKMRVGLHSGPGECCRKSVQWVCGLIAKCSMILTIVVAYVLYLNSDCRSASWTKEPLPIVW